MFENGDGWKGKPFVFKYEQKIGATSFNETIRRSYARSVAFEATLQVEKVRGLVHAYLLRAALAPVPAPRHTTSP